MGKRKRGKDRETQPPPAPARGRAPRRAILAGGGLLLAMAAMIWLPSWIYSPDPVPGGPGGDLPRMGESGPTLSPARFRGAVRRAYQVAREIPDLLDKLFCYCYCGRTFGHKSLLSCYASTHAAG